MKKLFILLVIGGMTLTAGAQKIGHIDSAALIEVWPGKDDLVKQLEAVQAELEGVLKQLQNDYVKLAKEIETKQKEWPKSLLELKVSELQGKEQDIARYQQSAQNDLAEKESELFQPVFDKAKEAIEKVAKANGFTYIIDSSVGVLLYAGGEDIMNLVKAELGIPLTAAPSAGQ
mgnify:CR=1 FL=1